MSNKVVIGYNGSAASSEALDWAAGVAARRGADLCIVSCFEVPVFGEPWSGLDDAFTVLTRRTDALLSRVRRDIEARYPGLVVETVVAAGGPVPRLVEASRPGDLVVIGGSRTADGLSVKAGTTYRRLVRSAPCPVVIVQGVASMGRPDRIVVGVDESSGADRALDWAIELADSEQVGLHIVHGWDYPYAANTPASAQARDVTRVDAQRVIDRAVERARERLGVPVTNCAIEANGAAALLQELRDGDLLVVGTRGRGRIKEALFGSTVQAVLDYAAVPVAVIAEHRQAAAEHAA